jgi:hypothetical protein
MRLSIKATEVRQTSVAFFSIAVDLTRFPPLAVV